MLRYVVIATILASVLYAAWCALDVGSAIRDAVCPPDEPE